MSNPLTELQARFAAEYVVNGGNATQAALVAGYGQRAAGEMGYRALQNPRVQDAIMRELQRIRVRSGAVGLQTLVSIAQNDSLPAAARVSAAGKLMEHAGLIGTAKEVDQGRREAALGGRIVDYLVLLRVIAAGANADPEDVAQLGLERDPEDARVVGEQSAVSSLEDALS